ncbi:MAG: signal peptidase I [Planctomycetes bacterium]|nr:signal peptidase I [Planctomycetota bacterium]
MSAKKKKQGGANPRAGGPAAGPARADAGAEARGPKGGGTEGAAKPALSGEEDKKEGKKKKKEKPPFHLWLKENVEAFFFAVILVLLVRYFSVEAFQIPTGSMRPTLIGAETNGDRILVQKHIYNFRSPERWEVVVFKYPLNRAKNFIKRLIGKGGERIAIQCGDIFVDGVAAEKPESVQKALWVRVYGEGSRPPPRGATKPALSGEREDLGDGGIEIDRLETDRGPELPVVSIQADLVLANVQGDQRAPIIDAVPDVRLSMKLRVDEGEGGVRFVLQSKHLRDKEYDLDSRRETRIRYVFDLEVDGGDDESRLSCERAPADEGPWKEAAEPITSSFLLAREREYQVEVVRLDGRAWLAVDGERVLSVEGPVRYEDAPPTCRACEVGFAPYRAKIEASELALDRDNYWTNTGLLSRGQEIEIPRGRYLFLGDNSTSSHDGRLWSRFRVRTEDGVSIEGEFKRDGEETNPIGLTPDGTRVRLLDVNGFEHLVDVYEVEELQVLPWHKHDTEVSKSGRFPDHWLSGTNKKKQKILQEGDPVPFWKRLDIDPRACRATPEELAVATVPEELIVGRAFFVFWPPARWEGSFLSGQFWETLRRNVKFIR